MPNTKWVLWHLWRFLVSKFFVKFSFFNSQSFWLDIVAFDFVYLWDSCVYKCVSLHLSVFLVLFPWLFFFSSACLVLHWFICFCFIFFLFHHYPLEVYYFLRRDRKAGDLGSGGEELGEGKHNQNMLCEKKSIFNKKKNGGSNQDNHKEHF